MTPKDASGPPRAGARCWPTMGVTLVELVITMAILALVSAIALPRFAALMNRQRLDLASRRLAEDLRMARQQAIISKADRSVTFDLALQRYTLSNVYLMSGNRLVPPVFLNADPYNGVRLTSAGFEGQPTVTFNRLGVPTAAGSVVLSNGSTQATITVSPTTGRVTRTLIGVSSTRPTTPNSPN